MVREINKSKLNERVRNIQKEKIGLWVFVIFTGVFAFVLLLLELHVANWGNHIAWLNSYSNITGNEFGHYTVDVEGVPEDRVGWHYVPGSQNITQFCFSLITAIACVVMGSLISSYMFVSNKKSKDECTVMNNFITELERVRCLDDKISDQVLINASVGENVTHAVASQLIQQFKKFRVVENITNNQDLPAAKAMLEELKPSDFSTYKTKKVMYVLCWALFCPLYISIWILSLFGFFTTEWVFTGSGPFQDAGTFTMSLMVWLAWLPIMILAHISFLKIHVINDLWAIAPYEWARQLLSFQDKHDKKLESFTTSGVEGRKSWNGKRQAVIDTIRIQISRQSISDSKLESWVDLWESLIDVPEYGRNELAIINQKKNGSGNIYSA